MTAWVEPVESRAILAVGHDEARSTLLVRFVSGETYIYFGVPGDLPGRFLAAESKGRFFQAEVLGRFTFEKVDAPP